MMVVCIGKDKKKRSEKADGQGRERKVAVCGKVKGLVDLIVRVSHGG